MSSESIPLTYPVGPEPSRHAVPGASARPSGRPLTVRVATWSARHRWPVVAGWFAFTVGISRRRPSEPREAPSPKRRVDTLVKGSPSGSWRRSITRTGYSRPWRRRSR